MGSQIHAAAALAIGRDSGYIMNRRMAGSQTRSAARKPAMPVTGFEPSCYRNKFHDSQLPSPI